MGGIIVLPFKMNILAKSLIWKEKVLIKLFCISPDLSWQQLVSAFSICAPIICHFCCVSLPAFVTHPAFLNYFQKISYNLQLLGGKEVEDIYSLWIQFELHIISKIYDIMFISWFSNADDLENTFLHLLW